MDSKPTLIWEGNGNKEGWVLFQIRDLIYQAYGLFFPNSKSYYLETRIGKRMESVGVDNYLDYYGLLRSNQQGEVKLLVNELMINETCFFRDMAQIKALENSCIPAIVKAKGKIGFKKIKIWSAGCSTGEEAYTVSMILRELERTILNEWSIEIIASDIDEDALARAERGHYNEYAVRRTPQHFKRKYFTHDPQGYKLSNEARRNVKFIRLNLYEDSKMVFMKSFDIILCCNVLIYFDKFSKRKVVEHFYNNLHAGGHLFLGFSESLYDINSKFKLSQFPGCIVYTKS